MQIKTHVLQGSFKKIIQHFLLPDCPGTDHQRETFAMNAFMVRNFQFRAPQTDCNVRVTISLRTSASKNLKRLHTLCEKGDTFRKNWNIASSSPNMGLTPLTHNYRLTYSPCDSILIVEMPQSIHEMPLTDFRESISSTVCNLPYDRYMIWASVEMNLPFQSPKDGYTATPNLSLLLASRTVHPFWALECQAGIFIWCFLHIINLCVQRTLNRYTEANFSNIPHTWINGHGKVIEKAEYIHWCGGKGSYEPWEGIC